LADSNDSEGKGRFMQIKGQVYYREVTRGKLKQGSVGIENTEILGGSNFYLKHNKI